MIWHILAALLPGCIRQWPEVYDLCHTFLKRVRFSHVRVFSDSGNVQKRATKLATAYEAWALEKSGSYKAFIFSVFSRNQEKTKPQTWQSVIS